MRPGEAAARALLQIGHRAKEMVPGLRALAEQAGDVEAAKGVWCLTGDPQPLLAAPDRQWRSFRRSLGASQIKFVTAACGIGLARHLERRGHGYFQGVR